MGSGGGELGAQGAGCGMQAAAGGRPKTAQAGSSLSAWGPGGTCLARSLNARRSPGTRGFQHLSRAVSAVAVSVVITIAVKRFHVCPTSRE